jgi:dGTPase
MINTLVIDLTDESRRCIEEARPDSIEAVRKSPPLIGFSEPVAQEQTELKQFLRNALYRHYRVVRMSGKSQRILTELFSAFISDLRLLPPQDQARAQADAPRAIADYIAGMTDRYAIREHRRLFSVEEH